MKDLISFIRKYVSVLSKELYAKYRRRASLRKGLKHPEGALLPMLSCKEKKEIDIWYEENKLKLNDYYYHRWYYFVTGVFSPKCIPEFVMNHQIITKFNDLRLCKAWADKSYYDMRFKPKSVELPYTILRNINGVFYDHDFNFVNYKEAEMILLKENKFIVKPSVDTGKGRKVRMYSSKCSPEDIFDEYSNNYVAQRIIEQHEVLSNFNKTSVNTFRIMSWFNGEEVHILATMLRIGSSGSIVDNLSSGGSAFGVKDDGKLLFPMRNKQGMVVLGSDKSLIEDTIVVPFYKKIIKTVKILHIQLPHFGIIAWDIAINKDGAPVLIEYNLETPGVHLIQSLCGSCFSDAGEMLIKAAGKKQFICRRTAEYVGDITNV